MVDSRMCRLACLAMLIPLAAPPVALAQEFIFELSDPTGDDNGDGSIRYPFRNDMTPGDLDIVRVAARPGNGGTWFEVNFARRIRAPERGATDRVGTGMDRIARLGFHTLNVDIYIDTDREPGSGEVMLLPGRLAEMSREHAWDRAVILTPSPHVAEDTLITELTRVARERYRKETGRAPGRSQRRKKRSAAAEWVAEHVWYARQVRITGNRADFFVPDSFLGSRARSDWSYLVGSSGAQLETRIRVPFMESLTLDPNTGMIMPVLSVPSDRAFGGRQSDPLQPTLIDIVVPAGSDQAEVLKDYDAAELRPVRLPGVVPVTDVLQTRSP